MRGRSFYVLALLVILSLAVLPVTAQEPKSEQEMEQNQEADGEPEEGIRPYEEVITDEAVSDEGIFTVHKVDDKFYYEIPASELGSEFLWVGRISRTSLGQGYGGMKLDTRVVKWERRDAIDLPPLNRSRSRVRISGGRRRRDAHEAIQHGTDCQ